MRAVLRDVDTRAYWDKRWSAFESDSDEFENMEIYPIKYVDRVMHPGTRTLEAGCGLGRVVKHYHRRGFDIIGCDYSSVAVEKLNQSNPELSIRQADITALPYQDQEFDNVLALGVFHGIEDVSAIKKGIGECLRCLKSGGTFIASVRADTLECRLIDKITEKRGKAGTKFHKWCFSRSEFAALIEEHGATVVSAELVTNVNVLSKFKLFRDASITDESAARSKGFELNLGGRVLYRALKTVLPESFGTTWVFTARK